LKKLHVSLSTFSISYFYYIIYHENMNGENSPLVLDDLVEVQDSMKNHF
jgi:hypothetical protein